MNCLHATKAHGEKRRQKGTLLLMRKSQILMVLNNLLKFNNGMVIHIQFTNQETEIYENVDDF